MRYLIFLVPVISSVAFSVFPVRSGEVWEHMVQLVTVSLLVAIPYLTRRIVNYRHWFPLVASLVLWVWTIIWSGVIHWSPFTVAHGVLLALVVQCVMVLIVCLGHAQLKLER